MCELQLEVWDNSIGFLVVSSKNKKRKPIVFSLPLFFFLNMASLLTELIAIIVSYLQAKDLSRAACVNWSFKVIKKRFLPFALTQKQIFGHYHYCKDSDNISLIRGIMIEQF